MLPTSILFIVCLTALFFVYWAMPFKLRQGLLLIVSIFFYMSWGAGYILFLACSIGISYFAAMLIDKLNDHRKKKTVLVCAVCLNLASLLILKYAGFIWSIALDICSLFSLKLTPLTKALVLPVGISFYTFQTLSYLFDVYREKTEAERNILIYALYVSFFPQILSGPINRADKLLPQYRNLPAFSYDQALFGLKLMLFGLFKKLVIADRINPFVDRLYSEPAAFSGLTIVLVVFLYAVQIYCDFSGYSDIAIGTAKLFGIDFVENFKTPYFSSTIKEFWSQWHISLSTWFRDYIYIPMGGNRVSKFRHCINLMLTFLVSGLWHGANWTFALWGGVHGIGQVMENVLHIRAAKKKGFCWAFRCFAVFVFISLAWVLFRAATIHDALYIWGHMLDGIANPKSYVLNGILGISDLGMRKRALFETVILIFPVFIADLIASRRRKSSAELLNEAKPIVQWIIFVAFACAVIILSAKGVATEFVYLQF